MIMSLDCFNIPLFVIAYNRVAYLERLITWLEVAGYKNIHIVDNASVYPPLLDYLRKSTHHVHRMDRNYGHRVVWDCGQFDAILQNEFYAVTDCDVLPVEDCPAHAVGHFYQVLQQYPNHTKVGFSLKIDDLPDCYSFKQNVIKWENQFWNKTIVDGLFEAQIDTTFALYRPGIYPKDSRWWNAIRTDHPFTARHLPWYQDSSSLSEEERFYQSQLPPKSTHWSVSDPVLLQEQNFLLSRQNDQLIDAVRGLESFKDTYWHVKPSSSSQRRFVQKVLIWTARRISKR